MADKRMERRTDALQDGWTDMPKSSFARRANQEYISFIGSDMSPSTCSLRYVHSA